MDVTNFAGWRVHVGYPWSKPCTKRKKDSKDGKCRKKGINTK